MTFRQCFFRYTWSDQNSSTSFTKFYDVNRIKKVFPFFRVTYNTGRDLWVFFRHCGTFYRKKYNQKVPLQCFRSFATEWMMKSPKGSPFQFCSSLWDFFKDFVFIKRSPIHQYFHTLKSFCNFWALDMVPTWAGPGLLFSTPTNSFMYSWGKS